MKKRVFCLYPVSTKKQVDKNDKNENDIPMQKKACHDFALRQEGRQCFESHIDKLLNYIRFWQASGESEKTSIRIRNKMQQMKLDGLYTGGAVRFGYHLADSGLKNRKGLPIRKYEVDTGESEILQMIDSMFLHKGYGAWRIANFLNENGYAPNDGGEFTGTKVMRILRDPFYSARRSDGMTSEALEGLRIREDDTCTQILYILDQRQKKNDYKRHIAMQTGGKAMLSGNLFCAHCGNRLTTQHYTDKRVRKDGSVYVVDEIKYYCYHKGRKLCECDGQTTYRADRVDETTRQVIKQIFSCLDGAPEREQLEKLYEKQVARNREAQKKLVRDMEKDQAQLDKLQLEIGNVLTGDSVFSSEDLTQAIRKLRVRIDESEKRLLNLKSEEIEKRQGIATLTPTYNRFKSWAEEFDSATLEQQKMIACNLFSRIEVGRRYEMKFEINMTYRQFCSEWGDGNLSVMEADA